MKFAPVARRPATVIAAAVVWFAPFVPNLTTSAAAGARPQHVFIIVLENEGFNKTFGPKSPAPYLNQLAAQGALLTQYYGIGHNSLDNYVAMVSGQAPNPKTQSDCHDYVPFLQVGIADYGQAIGDGCIYQRNVLTVANQLESRGLTWKGYMEDMGNDPARESASCGQPAIYFPDSTQKAEARDQYAARHNPFVYFYSILDSGTDCAEHVVNFSALAADLKRIGTTPNYSYITPNLCHDGHDGGSRKNPCANGEIGGLFSADVFLKNTVPKILASPAFRRDGLLIVTFDESDVDWNGPAVTGDASSCCHEQPGPNIYPGATVFGAPDHGPGIIGPGGGRIGAVLVSPFIKPSRTSAVPYNHYAMLRSIEDFFGLEHLGYAGQQGLRTFGTDRNIFN